MPKVVDETRIFTATMDRLMAHGYDGATTREIAAAAGINEVTLFRRYGSKAGLVERAIASGRTNRLGLVAVPSSPSRRWPPACSAWPCRVVRSGRRSDPMAPHAYLSARPSPAASVRAGRVGGCWMRHASTDGWPRCGSSRRAPSRRSSATPVMSRSTVGTRSRPPRSGSAIASRHPSPSASGMSRSSR